MASIIVPARIVQNTSKLWVRKQLTMFRVFDKARAGIVTGDDVRNKCLERASAVLPRGQGMQSTPVTEKLWKTVWAPAAMEEKHQGGLEMIPWDNFISSRTQSFSGAKKEEELESFNDIIDTMFKVADLNEDGMLQRREHVRLMALLGLEEDQAFMSFSAIDENDDDIISSEEFRYAFMSFLYNTGNDRSALVLGRLDDAKISLTD